MKKVLFYIDHRNRGGAQRVMVELANYFQKYKLYEVFFVTQFVSDNNAYPLDEHIREIVLEEKKGKNIVEKQLHRVQQLEKVCRNIKPDIIVSFLIITNIIALIVGKKTKIPVLISIRNDPTHDHSKILHILMRITYPMARGWVFQTENARSYFKNWIKGIDDIIINPLSSDVLDEIKHGKITGENKDNIVSVGRLDKQKRHDLLIKAYYAACGRQSKFGLIIYGEGPERQHLQKLIEELGLQKKVILAGITKNITEKIRSARLFAFSSDYEGMPNALLEAMAIGLPVISTNCPCGGPAMLIENGINGMLVEVGNENELANCLSKLLEDQELSRRLGENASKIIEKCELSYVAEKWRNIIECCAR